LIATIKKPDIPAVLPTYRKTETAGCGGYFTLQIFCQFILKKSANLVSRPADYKPQKTK